MVTTANILNAGASLTPDDGADELNPFDGVAREQRQDERRGGQPLDLVSEDVPEQHENTPEFNQVPVEVQEPLMANAQEQDTQMADTVDRVFGQVPVEVQEPLMANAQEQDSRAADNVDRMLEESDDSLSENDPEYDNRLAAAVEELDHTNTLVERFRAETGDGHLKDFEDALVEEEVDLLADAETQQKQAQATKSGGGGDAGKAIADLIGDLTKKKTPAKPPKNQRATKANQQLQKQLTDAQKQLADAQKQQSQRGPDGDGVIPGGGPQIPTGGQDTDGDGIPDSQDPNPTTPDSVQNDKGIGDLDFSNVPVSQRPEGIVVDGEIISSRDVGASNRDTIPPVGNNPGGLKGLLSGGRGGRGGQEQHHARRGK